MLPFDYSSIPIDLDSEPLHRLYEDGASPQFDGVLCNVGTVVAVGIKVMDHPGLA